MFVVFIVLPKIDQQLARSFLVFILQNFFLSKKESNSKSGKRTSKKIKILFSIFDVENNFTRIVCFLATILSETKKFFFFDG